MPRVSMLVIWGVLSGFSMLTRMGMCWRFCALSGWRLLRESVLVCLETFWVSLLVRLIDCWVLCFVRLDVCWESLFLSGSRSNEFSVLDKLNFYLKSLCFSSLTWELGLYSGQIIVSGGLCAGQVGVLLRVFMLFLLMVCLGTLCSSG